MIVLNSTELPGETEIFSIGTMGSSKNQSSSDICMAPPTTPSPIPLTVTRKSSLDAKPSPSSSSSFTSKLDMTGVAWTVKSSPAQSVASPPQLLWLPAISSAIERQYHVASLKTVGTFHCVVGAFTHTS